MPGTKFGRWKIPFRHRKIQFDRQICHRSFSAKRNIRRGNWSKGIFELLVDPSKVAISSARNYAHRNTKIMLMKGAESVFLLSLRQNHLAEGVAKYLWSFRGWLRDLWGRWQGGECGGRKENKPRVALVVWLCKRLNPSFDGNIIFVVFFSLRYCRGSGGLVFRLNRVLRVLPREVLKSAVTPVRD